MSAATIRKTQGSLVSKTWQQPSTISFKDLCIDAVDPEVLAVVLGAALGLRAERRGGDLRLVDEVARAHAVGEQGAGAADRQTARAPRRATWRHVV